MIGKTQLFLSILAGLSIGSPIARREAMLSNIGIDGTNAYYDLAALYGDQNQDGKLSADEFNAFDIDGLNLRKENDTFLGWIPTEGKMYFYFFERGPISSYTGGATTLQKAKDNAKSIEFSLYYYDSIEQDQDGYIVNDQQKLANPTFLNFYHGKNGYFYKFSFDYQTEKGNFHRIQPDSFGAVEKKEDHSISLGWNVYNKESREGEFFYDDNYKNENAVSMYFGYDSYEIEAVADMYLAITQQNTIYCPIFHQFDEKSITEAREITYVFFNFKDEDFYVDQIEAVNYHATRMSFTAHNYLSGFVGTDVYHNQIPNRFIYSGTKFNLDSGSHREESVDYFLRTDGKAYYYDHSEDLVEESITARISTGEETVTQYDHAYYLFAEDHPIRKSKFSNIVKLSDIDSKYTGDDWANFRTFMHDGDHDQYTWAFRLNDNLSRKLTGRKTVRTDNISPITGLVTKDIYDTTTTCHEYRDIVTLSMDVIKDNQSYTIKTINNPISVRNVSIIGYEAPSIPTIIIDYFLNFEEWPTWLKVIVIGAFVLLGLIVLYYLVKFFAWLSEKISLAFNKSK